MLFFVPNLYLETQKLPSVVTFTFIQTFDQNFAFFTERRHVAMWRVIFKICVIFDVHFDRQKVDKKKQTCTKTETC